jgi:hypothetical protein
MRRALARLSRSKAREALTAPLMRIGNLRLKITDLRIKIAASQAIEYFGKERAITLDQFKQLRVWRAATRS